MMNNTKPTWRDNLKALGYLLPMLIIVGSVQLVSNYQESSDELLHGLQLFYEPS